MRVNQITTHYGLTCGRCGIRIARGTIAYIYLGDTVCSEKCWKDLEERDRLWKEQEVNHDKRTQSQD